MRAAAIVALCGASCALALSPYAEERIRAYCAYPPYPAVEEGAPPAVGAVLLQAHVIVRHGDRSAIHVIPNTRSVAWPCTSPTADEVRWAAGMLRPFRSSSFCISTGGDACVNVTGAPLPTSVDRALYAWGRARQTGESCGSEGGDLSSIGWRQLLEIGDGLRHKYAALLERDDPATDALRVVSTDTGRTALSATAFVRGLLHHHQPADDRGAACAGNRKAGGEDNDSDSCAASQAASAAAADARTLPLSVGGTAGTGSDNGAAGLLPQMRLPLPLHILPREEDPLIRMTRPLLCPRARQMQQAAIHHMFAFARTPSDVAARIAAVADVDVEAVPGTEEVVDDIFARACHGHGLPCRDVDADMLTEVGEAAAEAAYAAGAEVPPGGTPGLAVGAGSSRAACRRAGAAWPAERPACCSRSRGRGRRQPQRQCHFPGRRHHGVRDAVGRGGHDPARRPAL
jgi:hypothetical protein